MREGTCDQPGCTMSGAVIVKHIPSSGNWCYACNKARLSAGKPKATYAKKTKKPTGEGVMFLTIWNTRRHVSFIDGTHLGDEMKTWFFAHVLPKSTYPHMRLLDRNIVLLTYDQHNAWDNSGRDKLRSMPEWEKMFSLEEELKNESKRKRK